jgi:hypothetical protein
MKNPQHCMVYMSKYELPNVTKIQNKKYKIKIKCFITLYFFTEILRLLRHSILMIFGIDLVI